MSLELLLFMGQGVRAAKLLVPPDVATRLELPYHIGKYLKNVFQTFFRYFLNFERDYRPSLLKLLLGDRMQRLKSPLSHLRRQWRRLSLAKRGAIAMAIPLLCLITSFSTHLWFRERDIQVENAVDHSQMVLLESYT
ncbi:MAG: hypothetical protein ACRC8A_14970, partial [Microcoleaceae cyanobacterium]